MRLRDDVTVRKTGGKSYLIPFAGAQAGGIRGAELNSEAATILSDLSFEITQRALAEQVAVSSDAGVDEVAGSVKEFVAVLLKKELIREETPSRDEGPGGAFLDIAGIHVYIRDGEFLNEALKDFSCEPFEAGDTDLSVKVTCSYDAGSVALVFSTNEFSLYENADVYVFKYSVFERVKETVLDRNFSHAVFVVTDIFPDEQIREEFFLCLRTAFLMCALKDRKVALHCAACADDSGAFLISGHSGMGKSTLASLVKDSYDVSLLNGDLGLLGTENGKPFIYGIPWCGTSGIYTRGKHPLSSVTFIQQSQENRIARLDNGSSVMTFMNRLITPAWSQPMLDAKLASASSIIRAIRLYSFCFKNEPQAAEVFYREIAGWHGV